MSEVHVAKKAPVKSQKDSARAAAKVRAYLVALPPEARRALASIRSAVRAVAPRAEAVFSYGIPGTRLEGKPLVWYAAFKKHVSLYPMTAAIRRAHARELEGYKMSTGTIQLPLARPVPVALVKKLVRARVAEVRASLKK
jgi:uncharacterized protein YdhG (YjbR/CyaY superfamily)